MPNYTISLAALIGLREAKHDQNLPIGSIILNAYHRQHPHLAAPAPASGVRPETNSSIGEIKIPVTAYLTAAETNLIKKTAADAGYPNPSAYINDLLLADLNIDPTQLRVTTTPLANDANKHSDSSDVIPPPAR